MMKPEKMQTELSVTVIATGFDLNATDAPQSEEPLPLKALPEIPRPPIEEVDIMQAGEEEQIAIFGAQKAPDAASADIQVFGEHPHVEETFFPLDEKQKGDMNVPAYLRNVFKRR